MSLSSSSTLPPVLASAGKFFQNLGTGFSMVRNGMPCVKIFGTLSIAPDGSVLNIPAVIQGFDKEDIEGQVIIGKSGFDLLARLCIAYFRSIATSTTATAGFGLYKDDAIKSQLARLVEGLVSEINAELFNYEKGRGYRIHWEILQNSEFRKRFGQTAGFQDRQFLGGWTKEEEKGCWKTDDKITCTLRNMSVVHLALSPERTSAKVFAVSWGRDRAAMEDWLDAGFWEELARKIWTSDSKGTVVPSGVKDAFIGLWRKRATAAGLPQFTIWTFDKNHFVRLLPEWEGAVHGQINALNTPTSHQKLNHELSKSGPMGERLVISPVLSRHRTTPADVPPPQYDGHPTKAEE